MDDSSIIIPETRGHSRISSSAMDGGFFSEPVRGTLSGGGANTVDAVASVIDAAGNPDIIVPEPSGVTY